MPPKSAESGGAKVRSLINTDDPGWKIAVRNRSAQLTVMQRTTFPDRLNLAPVDGQKAIRFVLVLGILTVIAFAFLVLHYMHFMQNSLSRRASYMLVYRAVHTSKMTTQDKKELMKVWLDGCSGMYATNWTAWRLALMPEPCPGASACHKLIKIRTRILIAKEPPDNGERCPPTIEWSELESESNADLRDVIFSGEGITEENKK